MNVDKHIPNQGRIVAGGQVGQVLAQPITLPKETTPNKLKCTLCFPLQNHQSLEFFDKIFESEMNGTCGK